MAKFKLIIPIVLQLLLLCGCSLSYGITKDNEVFCRQVCNKYGVVRKNSENISIDEIYSAEQIFLRYISSYYDNDINVAKKRYKDLYRQYCKKTINGDVIIYINYLSLPKWYKKEFIIADELTSDEPFLIFSEPGSDVFSSDYYVNLTQKYVCEIEEHNNLAKIFWSWIK